MKRINKLVVLISSAFLIGGAIFPFVSNAFAEQTKPVLNPAETLNKNKVLMIQDNTLVANTEHYYSPSFKKVWVIVTGYSSDPSQTDNTPFITASGVSVHWGIVAANFLPFGTRIKIPSLFGDEIFDVQDRMNPKKRYQVDIWFPSRAKALDFGAHKTYIEVLSTS